MRRREGEPAEMDLLESAAAGSTAIRGGVLRTAGFVGGLLVTLASAPLLIRHLGDADFGRYSAVLAVIAIVAGLTEGGVNTIALRELSATTDPEERDRLMGDLLGLRLVLSVVGVGLAVGFSAAAGYGSTLVLGTLLAGLGLLVMLTQTLIATVLQSKLRFGWAALLELLRQTITAGLILALVLADAGVVPFLSMAIPAASAALILTVVLVRGDISLWPAFHPDRWIPLLKDTLVFALAVAVNSLYFRISLVIMSLVATAAETGHFAVSFRVIEVLILVPTLLIGSAFPIISRSASTNVARFEATSARLFELGLYVGALIALCLLLSAPFAVEVLVGTSDHPSVGVLQIQSAAILASFIAAATGYPLLSMRRHRETLVANVASLAVAAGLTLALAPGLGARGAAIAAVTADFTLAGGNALMLVQKDGPALPLAALPVALGATLLGYAAGALVGVHPLVQAAVGGAVFLAVLAALGRFPPEVGEMLRRNRS